MKQIQNKVTRFFPSNNQNTYPSCKIYQRVLLWKEDYSGKTECDVVARWGLRSNLSLDLELAQYLKINLNHSFNWFIVTNVPSNK